MAGSLPKGEDPAIQIPNGTHPQCMSQGPDAVSIIESEFPESHHEIPPALHQFCKHLYTAYGVILYKDRIVIPSSLQQHILTTLHSAHQGVTSMTAHAESTIFCPGITPPSQPYKQTAVTATAWRPHSLVLHHSHPPHHYTHSRVFVLTFSNTRASIISSW